eukprot:Em0006g850a
MVVMVISSCQQSISQHPDGFAKGLLNGVDQLTERLAAPRKDGYIVLQELDRMKKQQFMMPVGRMQPLLQSPPSS